MTPASDNRLYKVTSLFIKAAILILSFVYIFHKFQTTNQEYDLKLIFFSADPVLLSITFLLLFFNWGIEAYKWQYLISSLERISFAAANKAVYAGVTVSIFMPNRIGEFAGRIFFLDKADKISATLKNFIGSFLQLLITLILGIISFFILVRGGHIDYLNAEIVDQWAVKLFLATIILGLLFLLVLNRFRERFPEKIRIYLRTIFDSEPGEILMVLFLSFIRYCIFLFQYYFVLMAFGVNPGLMVSLHLIAVTFFITSVVPSFAFTEIATRGAAAVFLFSRYTADVTSVVAASFVVWIINLAIPAVIGSAFIGKLKFYRQNG